MLLLEVALQILEKLHPQMLKVEFKSKVQILLVEQHLVETLNPLIKLNNKRNLLQ